jgi:phosphinothricin acetyltransferase
MSDDGVTVTVEPMSHKHWPAVRQIYIEGLDTGNASFETAAPTWQDFHDAHLAGHLLVAIEGGTVVGWAGLSPASTRTVYAGVAEESVYISTSARGRGVGRRLLTELVERAEAAGIWTVQAGIFPDNTASVALHQACGFRTVGVRERIGQRAGVWRDVLLLEWRSDVIT